MNQCQYRFHTVAHHQHYIHLPVRLWTICYVRSDPIQYIKPMRAYIHTYIHSTYIHTIIHSHSQSISHTYILSHFTLRRPHEQSYLIADRLFWRLSHRSDREFPRQFWPARRRDLGSPPAPSEWPRLSLVPPDLDPVEQNKVVVSITITHTYYSYSVHKVSYHSKWFYYATIHTYTSQHTNIWNRTEELRYNSTCARSWVKAPSSKPSPSILAPDRSGSFPDKALIKVDFPNASKTKVKEWATSNSKNSNLEPTTTTTS